MLAPQNSAIVPLNFYAVATILTLWDPCGSKPVLKKKLSDNFNCSDHCKEVGLILQNQDRKEYISHLGHPLESICCYVHAHLQSAKVTRAQTPSQSKVWAILPGRSPRSAEKKDDEYYSQTQDQWSSENQIFSINSSYKFSQKL